MKLQLTLGSDTPRKGALLPLVKLALVGAVALLVMNRSDIRRYLRLRRM
jgi:hypothetical protein